MRILITTTFNRNLTEAKVKPLVLLPEVERILYVSDRPGPFFEKVDYYCVPRWMLRFFNNSSVVRLVVKFLIVFYLAIFRRPDLLMGYSLMPHGVNVALIGKALRIPFIVNIIGGAYGVEGGGFKRENTLFSRILKKKGSFLEGLLLSMLRGSDYITVTGSSTRDFLISRGVDRRKIRIISSTIDTDRFFPAHTEDTYDLIAIGELIPRKRMEVFLEVVSRLVRQGIDIKAAIVGDGMLRRQLEDLSKDLGLEDAVRFVGFDSEVERHLNASTIFLLPSGNEGLSLAVLEAMACGVVPVVSDVDDLQDAVKDGVNGRLVHKDDMDGFVSAVSGLLKDSRTLNLYSKSAIETIRNNYTIGHASKKWREILSAIGSERKARNWYINRLKAMPPLEIAYRLIRILRTGILRKRFLLSKKTSHLSSRVFRGARFFIDKKDIDFIRERYTQPIRDLDIELFKDSLSGSDFSSDFRSDIRRRAGLYGQEIKKAWEPCRFQWLVSFAQRYALDRDERIAENIARILKDWIRRNPALKGINWSDSMEVSLRLLSWSWVYFLIKDSAALDRDFENTFLRSIYFHASLVESNLSRYSSANNHLIGEALGLFMAGALFPQLRDSHRWLTRGKGILEDEIKKQVYPDGVSKEQSTGYHAFVTDLYLLAVVIGRRNRIRFSEEALSRLEKMCEFLMYMMNEEGNMSSIGDSDGGVAIKLDIFRDTPNAVSILNTASVIFDRPDFKRNGGSFDEKSLWLLGREGFKRHSLLKNKNGRVSSRGFSSGGYYVMRHKDMSLGFDCGPLGYLSLAAHGHADALSFTLSVGDRHIFVDPGTYLYHSDNKWRNYFRSTKAHNTVRIDRSDQSEITGPFLWGYKAETFLRYWYPDGGYDKVCGYHTGYARLKDPVIHSREIIFNKSDSRIIIKDSLCSKKRHFLEQFLHLHPGCSLTRTDSNGFEILNEDVVVRVELDRALGSKVLKGDEDPICGWYSERFGKKEEAPTICTEGCFEGDAEFITSISVRKRR